MINSGLCMGDWVDNEWVVASHFQGKNNFGPLTKLLMDTLSRCIAASEIDALNVLTQ